MKKKLIFFLLAASMFLLIWIVFSVNQPPKWIGYSQDGQWKADYNEESNAPKGDWIGYLYLEREKEAKLLGAELRKNGELIHQLENSGEVLTKEKNKINYIHSWESMFKDSGDKLQLKIFWEDENGEHDATINLSPEKRFFVVPNFLK
ncbi:hypothetical protein ACFVAD_08060 [Sutcliffiella sp. NPDC057660]|uniref:hypothetical protein n=1 Tax=Sutcliffiella sp. NPDC057660 TaxID=3346199 RepID=UPI0036A82943